jgi:GNAT superfamily N-acetyltransferase
MTDGIKIRAARPEDAGTIHAMLAELTRELGLAADTGSTDAVIRSHGFGPQARFSTLIAEAGAPVGFALYFPHFSTLRGQPGAYVQDLWAGPACRGQRVGARLLAAVAEAALRDWGAGYLALSVHAHNAAAGRFYERLGFAAQSGEQPMILDGAGFAALAGSRKAMA